MRLKRIYLRLKKENLDGIIVSSQSNIAYLTGFRSRDSYLLVSQKATIYFTDARYTQAAKKNLKKPVILHRTDGAHAKLIADTCMSLRLRRIGFEDKNLSFRDYQKIKEGFRGSFELVPAHNLIEELRQIKNQDEIIKIEKAVKITVEAFRFIKNFISTGKKEIEIAAELERFIRYNGADTSAFDIIVASGPNSSFPHHLTSQRKIKNNEVVLIDAGIEYMGYKSDLTRVFFLGKINALTRRIYDIVREAQMKAIKEIKPGVYTKEIDAIARQYIRKNGYGGFFNHGLGHGIGLEIHESPRLSPKDNIALKAGMVFTLEPAIYLPGKFGIRLEDIVLVTKKGCEVLSGTLDK